MAGGSIIMGYLTFIRNSIPLWVTSPLTGDISTPRAYVRVPHRGGLIAFLHAFPHDRASNIHGDRGFLRTANNEILTAFLKPHNQTLDVRRGARLYIRMPNHNYELYSAALRYVDGHRPDWL